MYNTTAAVSNKGRKPGWKKQQMEAASCIVVDNSLKLPVPQTADRERVEKDQSAEQLEKDDLEEVACSNDNYSTSSANEELRCASSSSGSSPKTQGSSRSLEQQREFLDDLKKAGGKTCQSTVLSLLRNTVDSLEEAMLKIHEKNRLDYLLETFPIFRNPEYLIRHMIHILPEATMKTIEKNFQSATEKILDFVFLKNLIKFPRSALDNDELKSLVAFVHLPRIGGRESLTGLKLLSHQILIHVLKGEETPQEVQMQHKKCSWPWVMHQKFGTETNLIVMHRDSVLFKVRNCQEAILSVMGLHYCGMLPYSPQVQGPLLFIQAEILADKVHSKDVATLRKFTKELEAIQKEKEKDISCFL